MECAVGRLVRPMGQVVLKGINKFYDSVHAVKDVNLQIRDKEFVVFVGPSGCGKTTTLRMIAGLEAISSGDISIDGTVVNALAPMDRDIAMVFQNYALYPHMSVFDNMAFGLKMLHLRLGTTAIYVTHDQVEAMTLGDRVVVMKDGVVQQVGEPLELYNQPANKFVAGFIGSPAMNFAAVTVTEANGSLIAENSGLRIKLPDETAQRLRGHIGREVTLGVRPEDLTVAGAADLDHPCFDAVIEVVEQLGSEILLDMKVGEGVMVASVEPTARVKVHDKLRVAMRPSRLHVFDAKTGAAI